MMFIRDRTAEEMQQKKKGNRYMNSYSKEAGRRIHLFRQARGISQAELAEQIHKTKSAVSKYERGEIAMDLETLHEICRALSVTPSELLAFDQAPAARMQASRHEKLYCCNLAGPSGRLTRSLMEIYASPGEENGTASLFYGVSSLSHPEKCQAFYQGAITRQQVFTNIHLTNQKNTSEQVSICYRANLDNQPFVVGMLSGLSFDSLTPVVCKIIVSADPLPEDDLMKELLAFSQTELKKLRSTGILTLKSR